MRGVGNAAIELLSIGYEGRDLASFIDLLVAEHVDVVVDVRLHPVSRKPGFSKTRLAHALDLVDIEYRHMPELGNPKHNRAPFHSGDVAVGLVVFEKLLRAKGAQEALAHLVRLAQTKRVAVLCFELEHGRCHRQAVINAVAALQPRPPKVQLLGG